MTSDVPTAHDGRRTATTRGDGTHRRAARETNRLDLRRIAIATLSRRRVGRNGSPAAARPTRTETKRRPSDSRRSLDRPTHLEKTSVTVR